MSRAIILCAKIYLGNSGKCKGSSYKFDNIELIDVCKHTTFKDIFYLLYIVSGRFVNNSSLKWRIL